MQFSPPLLEARLLQRYKRFLCDVVMGDGEELTAHIADPGRLPGLAVPGATVWLSKSGNPKRKLSHSVEMIEQAGNLVGVRPALANQLVHEALDAKKLPEIQGYCAIEPEFRLHAKTRIDFRLAHPDGSLTFIEVKSASWNRDGRACFPDAPTSRGRKHLQELAELRAQGHRAIILFVAQRADVDGFAAARDIDPAYAGMLADVTGAGVEALAYKCKINLNGIFVDSKIA